MKTIRDFCLFFLLLPFAGSSQSLVDVFRASQVSVDSFLLANGDEWHIKKKISIFGKLPKTKFGPFETIEAIKGKAVKADSKNETLLEVANKGSSGFVAQITDIDNRSDRFTVLYKSTDSIFIDMRMQMVTEKKRPTILFGKQDQPYESTTTTYWVDAFIKTTSYRTPWHLMAIHNVENKEKADSIEIKRVSGFKIVEHKKVDTFGITEGFAMVHDGIQAAAVQTKPEINVWIRKDLSDEYKQILGGIIIAIIAGNPN